MNQIDYISKQNMVLDEHWIKILSVKGNIKTYSETTFQAVLSCGKIIKGEIIKARDNDTRRLFDKKTNILEEHHYKSDGSPDYKYVYEYDSRGNQTEINYYNPFDNIKHKFILIYDDKDNEIERTLLLSERTIGFKMLFKYDDNGNRIEHIRLKPDGTLYQKIIYKYNSSGNETEKCIFNQDGFLKLKRKYDYDEKGKLRCENNSEPNGCLNFEIIYNYNEKGNPSDSQHYKLDGKLVESYIYRYDEHDNAVELIWSHSDGSYYKANYKYDERGNEIESCLFDSPINGNIVERFTYVYSDSGYIIESNHFVFTGNQIDKYTTNFEYDRIGNCIKSIRLENDIPQDLLEIEIEYD